MKVLASHSLISAPQGFMGKNIAIPTAGGDSKIQQHSNFSMYL